MSEAPKRIWCDQYGNWSEGPEEEPEQEYIRADLVEKLVRHGRDLLDECAGSETAYEDFRDALAELEQP